MILENKKSYRETSKSLKISLSTLKLIVSRYEETGTVFQSKSDRKNSKQFSEQREESELSHVKFEFHPFQAERYDDLKDSDSFENLWVWFPFTMFLYDDYNLFLWKF